MCVNYRKDNEISKSLSQWEEPNYPRGAACENFGSSEFVPFGSGSYPPYVPSSGPGQSQAGENKTIMDDGCISTGNSIYATINAYSIEVAGRRMSFVGMWNRGNEIITFADSKTSVRLEDGSYVEDKNRGRINKIITCKDYIVASYGCNQFHDQNVWNGPKINVEDWVRENMGADPLTTFMHLYEHIRFDGLHDMVMGFLIGGPYHGQLYLQDIQFTSGGCFVGKRLYAPGLLTRGDEAYCSQQDKIMEQLDRFAYLGTPEKLIEDLVKGCIEQEDKKDRYNPAGYPVRTKIWVPSREL